MNKGAYDFTPEEKEKLVNGIREWFKPPYVNAAGDYQSALNVLEVKMKPKKKIQKQKPRQKVFIILEFWFDECQVHSVYSTREKAEERASHVRIQNKKDGYSVAVIEKKIVGRVKL